MDYVFDCRATLDEIHAFTDREDVKDLTRQLTDGLIHPVEYASAINILAREAAII